jgi:hypothetical protein
MTDMNTSDANSQGFSQGSSTTSGLKDAAGQTYQEVRSKALDAVSRTTEAARSQASSRPRPPRMPSPPRPSGWRSRCAIPRPMTTRCKAS